MFDDFTNHPSVLAGRTRRDERPTPEEAERVCDVAHSALRPARAGRFARWSGPLLVTGILATLAVFAWQGGRQREEAQPTSTPLLPQSGVAHAPPSIGDVPAPIGSTKPALPPTGVVLSQALLRAVPALTRPQTSEDRTPAGLADLWSRQIRALEPSFVADPSTERRLGLEHPAWVIVSADGQRIAFRIIDERSSSEAPAVDTVDAFLARGHSPLTAMSATPDVPASMTAVAVAVSGYSTLVAPTGQNLPISGSVIEAGPVSTVEELAKYSIAGPGPESRPLSIEGLRVFGPTAAQLERSPLGAPCEHGRLDQCGG